MRIMGANMQFNSYFPRYYNAVSLSLDGNGTSWPLNHGNKVSEDGNLYNNNAFLSPDYLLAYNKELLKQTMLKHETIFKDQIQELHRIYRRQRELMNEIQRNEFNSYLKSDASHSNIAFFQAATEYVQKNFQAQGFVNPSSRQLPVLGAEKDCSRTSLVQGNGTQAFPKDVQLLESKFKKVGKKVLDLQLPADEYIDCEERDLVGHGKKVSEGPEALSYSVSRSPQVVYTNDLKSFFVSNASNSVFNNATETPPSVLHNPNVAGKLKEQTSGFLSPTGHSDRLENTKSGIQFSLEETVRNTQKRSHLEVVPNLLPPETRTGWEQLSYSDKTGIYGGKLNSLAQGFNVDKLPSVSKWLHKDLEQAFRPPPTFQHGNQSLSVDRKIYGSQSCGINSDSLNDGLSERHGALRGSIFDDRGPQINDKKNSEPVLTLRESCESGRTPIAVQALPCFSSAIQIGKRYKSSVGRPELAGDSNFGPDNDGLKEHTGSANNSPSKNYMSFKQPRCFSELAGSEGIWTTHGMEKREISASGFSWLRAKPDHVGKDNGLDDVVPKKTEETCSSSKTVPGSSKHNESFVSSNYSSETCQDDVKSKGKLSALDLNMACDSVPETETELFANSELVVENRIDHRKDTGFTSVIDLNSSANETELPQKSSHTAEMDLDAPPSPENKECSPSTGESDGNVADTATILSGQEDSEPQDELAKIAAEAIIFISSSFFLETSLKEIASEEDTLEWFAGIVSSVASNPIVDIENDDDDDDEIDHFEAMTLSLAEMKPDECCCRSNCSKEEETAGTTSSSPGQQRKKGRARRGRHQRKDFQREILPSLASLSRHEVTEDLQMIGGLTEAAGAHWETGSVMRYGARNGARKRGSVAPAEPHSKQHCSGDGKVGKEERSVISWGKVTRRRRGQRCPVRVINRQQLILTQV